MSSVTVSSKSVCKSTAGGVDPCFSLFDPIILAMIQGNQLWGDICVPPSVCNDGVVTVAQSSFHSVEPVESPVRMTEEQLLAFPFASLVEMRFSNMYDIAALSDSDYEAFMICLFDAGWDVVSESRRCVHAYPDSLPSRVWVSPSRFELAAQSGLEECCSGHKHNHSHAPAPTASKKRTPVAIPRFCKAGAACAEEGCRYIHGDTIPRLDKPCSFGATCGASDPTGVKRAQCLYMHPGETWDASLVITRPAPTP